MPAVRLGRWLAVLALLFELPVASACRCPQPPSAAEAYRYAHLVVEARVVSLADDPARKEATAIVSVSRSWKAAAPASLQVSTGLSCAYPFEAGEDLLLYLRRDPRTQRWETRRCSGNLPLREAARSLQWLQRHGKAFTPAR